jgi:hypothetical protein
MHAFPLSPVKLVLSLGSSLNAGGDDEINNYARGWHILYNRQGNIIDLHFNELNPMKLVIFKQCTRNVVVPCFHDQCSQDSSSEGFEEFPNMKL